jgi:hypothetical protein
MSFAHQWEGTAVMICLDTPSPIRFSGQEEREAYESSPPNSMITQEQWLNAREKRLKALKEKPMLFAGKLFVEINEFLKFTKILFLSLLSSVFIITGKE